MPFHARTRTSRPHLLTFIAAAVLIAATACTAEEPGPAPLVEPDYRPTTTVTSEPPDDDASPALPADVASERLTVFLDGWSHRTINEFTIYADVAGYDPFPLDFEPASAADVERLLDHHPDWMAAWGGRMINTDFDWTCDGAGCATAASTFTSDQLNGYVNDASTIPGYGASYEGWELGAGLYKATLEVPEELEAADFIGASPKTPGDEARNSPSWVSHRWVPFQDSVVLRSDPDGKAVLLSAGLGVIFSPHPQWVTSDTAYSPVPSYGFYPNSSDTLAGLLDEVPNSESSIEAAKGGLAAHSPSFDLRHLSDNELTYLTSPTVGCAVWVLCVPDVIDVEVSDQSSEIIEVCLAPQVLEEMSEIAGYEVAERTPATFTVENRRMILPAASHLNGVWDGLTPDKFAPPTMSDSQLLSAPPLAVGDVELHVATLRVYAAAYESDYPSLWLHLSRVFQLGSEEVEQVSVDELLQSVSETVSTC